MRPIENMTAEEAAEVCAGLHYKSRDWRDAAAAADWGVKWPEIDRDGILTGRTVGDEPGYLNVAGEAMIPVAEAVAGGWRIDREEGRAEPAPVARHEERPAEGTGWYVYVGGQDAGGPFETEADALSAWKPRS